MKYGIGFRNGILRKVLPPENRGVVRRNGLHAEHLTLWEQELDLPRSW